ncbi:MAG: hypothetical protein ABIJ59_00610 [Pseudomonadota bacterium]
MLKTIIRLAIPFTITLALSAHIANAQAASTENIEVAVAKGGVRIPSPVGLHEASQKYTEIKKIGQSATPPTNELRGFFLTEEDLQRIDNNENALLERYALLQVPCNVGDVKFSAEQFISLSNSVKNQQKMLMQQFNGGLDKNLDVTSDVFLRSFVNESSSQDLQYLPFGVFVDTVNLIGYAGLTVYGGMDEHDVPYSNAVVMSAVIVDIRGKIVYCYVYAKYRDKKDIDWAIDTAKSWAEHVLKSNRNSLWSFDFLSNKISLSLIVIMSLIVMGCLLLRKRKNS